MQYDQISFDLIDPAIETEKDRYIENLEYKINITENKIEYEDLWQLYVSAN